MAALWKLPVVFVCENNYYEEYHPAEWLNAGDVADRAHPFGIPGVAVDGNDVVAVYPAAQKAVARARAGEGPSLLECRTYRGLGHNTNDPAEYMPAEEIEAWKQKDPVKMYRSAVLDGQLAAEDELATIDQTFALEASGAMEFALDSPIPTDLAADIFAPAYEVTENAPAGKMRNITMREALIEAMMEEMERDESVILLGEDVGKAGGVFKTSVGLWERFGAERVIDTPISENGYTGAAVGAALTGMRPGGRDHVHRLNRADDGPHRQLSCQNPLHDRRPGVRASSVSGSLRRRLCGGRHAFPKPRGVVLPHSGIESRSPPRRPMT